MKITYIAPDCEFMNLSQEGNVLSVSGKALSSGTSSGQDMDDADYSQNPF